MAIESATYINQLDPTNPGSNDPVGEGDNHTRLLKSVLKATFPNVSGPINLTAGQLSNPILTTTPVADQAVYFTSGTTAANYVLTAHGRSLVAQPSAAAVLSMLGADAKYTINNATNAANITFTGTVAAASFTVVSTAPSITFQDTTWANRTLHMNDGLMGFLDSGGNWSWRNDNAGSTWQNGTAYAGNFYLSSDPRLKKDIRPISPEGAEAFIRNVNGYVYRMIDTDKLMSGVLSTEVKQMVPALVEEFEGFDRVNQDAIIPYLLVHSRTLTDEINDLKLELRALRDQLASMSREAIVPAPVTGAP